MWDKVVMSASVKQNQGEGVGGELIIRYDINCYFFSHTLYFIFLLKTFFYPEKEFPFWKLSFIEIDSLDIFHKYCKHRILGRSIILVLFFCQKVNLYQKT